MTDERFFARVDANGTWSIEEGSGTATFPFWGDLQGLSEDQARLITNLLNALERKRIARQVSLRRSMDLHR